MSDPLLNEYSGVLAAIEKLQREVAYLNRIAAAIPLASIGVLTEVNDEEKTAAGASFDFDGIPQSYKHLMLVGNLRGDAAATSVNNLLRLNNVSSANYYDERHQGAGAATAAAENLGATSAFVGTSNANTATANTAGKLEILIPDYTEDSLMPGGLYRSFFNTALTTGAIVIRSGGFFLNVAGAITRITLTPSAGNWNIGSRLSLYGMG